MSNLDLIEEMVFPTEFTHANQREEISLLIYIILRIREHRRALII